MFESDDFDSVLSQLEYTDSLSDNTSIHSKDIIKVTTEQTTSKNNFAYTSNRINFASPETTFREKENVKHINYAEYDRIDMYEECDQNITNKSSSSTVLLHKSSKRKSIGSFFDRSGKRKFPGPAGLLTGTLDENNDDNISRREIFSQDVNCSQDILRPDIFESKLWCTLQHDLRNWGLDRIECISSIKQAALAGRLTKRKAHAITAFIETIDRSAIDPLIILRDSTGAIKCTLHRDAWSAFSPYIISEYTALALWKPTVLTTGSAFKKHYLNITLSNIIAIYSSNCIITSQNDIKPLPHGYGKISLEDFTIVKMDKCPDIENGGPFNNSIAECTSHNVSTSENHLEGLDDLSFLDEAF